MKMRWTIVAAAALSLLSGCGDSQPEGSCTEAERSYGSGSAGFIGGNWTKTATATISGIEGDTLLLDIGGEAGQFIFPSADLGQVYSVGEQVTLRIEPNQGSGQWHWVEGVRSAAVFGDYVQGSRPVSPFGGPTFGFAAQCEYTRDAGCGAQMITSLYGVKATLGSERVTAKMGEIRALGGYQIWAGRSFEEAPTGGDGECIPEGGNDYSLGLISPAPTAP